MYSTLPQRAVLIPLASLVQIRPSNQEAVLRPPGTYSNYPKTLTSRSAYTSLCVWVTSSTLSTTTAHSTTFWIATSMVAVFSRLAFCESIWRYSHFRAHVFLLCSALSDDHRAMDERTVPHCFQDLVRLPAWLMTTSGFTTTNPHADAKGLKTFIIPASGEKWWFALGWTVEPTPMLLLRRRQCLSYCDVYGIEYSQKPPWVISEVRNPHMDWNIWRATHVEWEKFRVARWYAFHVEPGMML